MGYPQHGHAPAAAKPAVEGQTFAIVLLVCAALLLVTVFSHSWFTASGEGGSAGVGPLGLEMCRGGGCQSMSWGDMGGGDKVPTDIKMFSYLIIIAGLGAAALMLVSGGMIFSRNLAKVPYKPARAIVGVAGGAGGYWLARFLMEKDMGPFGISWAGILYLGATITGGIMVQKIAPLVAYSGGAPRPAAAYGGAPGYGGAPAYGGVPAYGQPPMQQPPTGQPPMQQPAMGQPAMGQPVAAHVPTPMQQPLAQQHPPMQQQPQAQHQPAGNAALGTAPTMAAGAGPSYPCPRCQRSLVFVAQYQRWFCESCKQYA